MNKLVEMFYNIATSGLLPSFGCSGLALACTTFQLPQEQLLLSA